MVLYSTVQLGLIIHLELEDLVLAVAKLSEVTRQLTLVGGAVLVARDGLVQAGGTANEDLDVLLVGRGDDGLQELLGDEALALGPVLGGLVEDVEGAETVGVLVLELLELLLEEDVLLGDVAEDEGDLGLVLGVLEDGARELVHGGDTGTAGNQGNVVVLVGLPRVLRDGALHLELLADSHVVHVLRHNATGVLLDNEVEVALGILVGNGSVRTDGGLLHLRALVLGDERAGDIEARNGILFVQLEAQLLGVVVDDLHGVERKLDEALVAASEALDGAVASLAGDVGLLSARGRSVSLRLTTSSVPVSSSERSGANSTVHQAIAAGSLGRLRRVVTDVL